MATKLFLGIPDEKDRTKSKIVYVQEDFDTVLEHVHPTRGISSALENREGMLFTLMDERRIAIPNSLVLLIEENAEVEED